MNRIASMVIGFYLISALGAGAQQPGGNVALGKKYHLQPRPNYSHCTDPDDKIQLTDGIYSEGHFWTRKTTVGWSRAHPAMITIDLEGIQPICGISYSTAAGVAGVTWPLFILILVSDDGKAYYCVGDLVELDAEHGKPKAEGYGVHRFWTDKLATHGRFVKLLVIQSPYTFVDEIEIYRGPEGLIDEPLAGKEVKDIKKFFTEMEVAKAVRRRLQNDLDAVRRGLENVEQRGELEKQLAAIEKEIRKLKDAPSKEFKTILPLNDLHQRIFEVQAAAWRAKEIKPITVWQKNRWDMVSPTETPHPGEVKIDVAMMSNEFRSAAFNISNAGETPIKLRMSIVDLPGRRFLTKRKYITVHDAPFTDTKSGVPVVAALPQASRFFSTYQLEIQPGMTRQVWLTFNPKDIPAGEYRGKIAIEPGAIQIPARLKIYPFTFPDEPTLHLGGWDYTNVDKMYNVTPENRSAVIKHLREHFVDTPWATSGALPYGKYDEKGNMIEEPDPSNFETWIQRWPDARNYYVFAAVREKFCEFEMGTPVFEKAVTSWITWWANKLKEWHIKPEQLGLLLVDEPSNEEKSRIIIEYAKVIQKAQPKVVVWEDVTWREPWKAPPELFTLSDTLCPNLPMWIEKGKPFAEFYVKQRDAGRTLWFYSCSGPGKLLDPYSYHRMQHWFLWKYDGKGSCFWAFGDSNRASSWNEYLSQRGAYTPVFLDDKSVTPGKHMEAIREGVEDYEYLRMLRDRIAELEKAGKRGEAIDSAKKLLTSAADQVTACMTERDKIKWEEPKDRSVADRVRIEVLEMLMKLKDL